MGFAGTWRRRAGAVLVVALIALVALVPTFDSVICLAEAPSAPHAAADIAAGEHSHEDPSGGCAHGHCHHAASRAPEVQDAVALPPQRERFAPVRASPPMSNRHFRPIRPPRA